MRVRTLLPLLVVPLAIACGNDDASEATNGGSSGAAGAGNAANGGAGGSGDTGGAAGSSGASASGGTAGTTSGATATLDPSPDRYWYVDRQPLDLAVAGEGVVQYRAAIDDAEFGAPTPVGDKLALNGVPAGKRKLRLIGADADGNWQTTPTEYEFYAATVSTEAMSCKTVAEGGECDYVLTAGYYATSANFYDEKNPGCDPTDNDPPCMPDGIPDYETLLDVGPGSRICLHDGFIGGLTFRGLRGSEEAPLTVINCGGVAQVHHTGTGAGLAFIDAQNVRLVGVGVEGERHGIRVDASSGPGANGVEFSGGSSGIEVSNVEIVGAGYAGIVARTDVSCDLHRDSFAQKNTFLHDNYVHGTPGEGFYIGGSHWARAYDPPPTCGQYGSGTIDCGGTCRFEPELNGLRVHDNLVEDVESDGIQVSSARSDDPKAFDQMEYNSAIYRNRVVRAAIGTSGFNSGSMSIQGGTSGKVYANQIFETGAYAGLFVGSQGYVSLFNNVVAHCPAAGIAVQDNDFGALNGPFWILNNTVADIGEEGIYMYHEHSTDNLCLNNLIIESSRALRVNSANVQWTESHNVTTGTLSEQFADPAHDDLRMSHDSTARGTGIDTSPQGVVTDIAGTARSTPYDVGAYNYYAY